MGKISYNKLEEKTGRKKVGGSGPRDLQRRQQIIDGQEANMAGSLPFDEVRRKIEEAVEFTRRQERERIKDVENALKEKDETIKELEIKLRVKDEVLETSASRYMKAIDDLKMQMNELITKIADGSIKSIEEIESHRPRIKDDIFIDPIDNDDKKLDAYIDIDGTPTKRDIISDRDKLRKLLNK